MRTKTATALLLPLFLLLLVACGGDAPTAPAPTAAAVDTATVLPPPSPTTTATAISIASPTAVAGTATAGSASPAAPTSTPPPPPLFTVTPYPGATPTAAALNAPVALGTTGEYECGDYPCFDDVTSWEARINLPPGFTADDVVAVEPHPTSITFGPDGRLYVARQEGEIVAVDADGHVESIVAGFYQLVGLAFQPGTDRLFATSRAEGDVAAILWVIEDGEARRLYGDLPCCYGGWHQANGIAFGPDGYGYVSVGARSDHGKDGDGNVLPLEPMEASVLRFDPNGGDLSVFATGLRNTFDIAWDGAGRLFGADNMPDFGPPEEFNQIMAGRQYGYPYYDCDDCIAAPADVEIVPPLHELTPHSAPTGVTVYLADAFPGYYNNIFLTLWSAFPGAQKVVRFGPGGEGMTDFATGFAAPVDVTVGPDGRLYVADWVTGIIFAIAYEG